MDVCNNEQATRAMRVAGGAPSISEAACATTALARVPVGEQIAFEGDTLLLRGTLDWKQMLQELRVGKVACRGGGTVHRGFHDIYGTLREEIFDAIDGRDVARIVGHSLGGVLGVLAADELLWRGCSSVRQVYTVGAPRMGDRTWARRRRPYRVVRIYNVEDLVTRVPPLCQHVGTEVPLHFDHGSILLNHDLTRYSEHLNARASLAGVWRRV